MKRSNQTCQPRTTGRRGRGRGLERRAAAARRRAMRRGAITLLALLLWPIDAALAQPITAPVLLERVEARYPPAALEEGREGTLQLLITVEADGGVGEVRVLSPLAPDLEAAAIEAVRRWRFRPAMREGRPIASRIRVPFVFEPPSAEAVPAGPERPAEAEPETETETEAEAETEAETEAEAEAET
ncbi:MAG: TonB family protein, partial [Myxococcales bacterium]|nr:TonB family protein [Myxococcales bacterium]